MTKNRRRKARSPRTRTERVHKTRFLSIRLTPEEYAELEARSKAAGSATVSAHCRLRIIGLFAENCDPLCPKAAAKHYNARAAQRKSR